MSLSRRTFLRGLGGVCLALPALEYFTSREAAAAVAPKRYVVAFGGVSLGLDDTNHVTPSSDGPLASVMTRGLQPLVDLGVVEHASVVSGLQVPWGSTIPAGGRGIRFHSMTPCPLLSGMRSKDQDTETLQGPTSDWIVAEAIGGPTFATRPVLTYRVQPAYYRGSNGTGGTRGTMSARLKNGKLEQITPQFSPQVAFKDLFTGFVPSDPVEAKKASALLARRKSIIDLVGDETESLAKKLGTVDRQRLERHLDEVRGLELKIASIELPDGTCLELPDPGADPALGTAVENGDDSGYAANGAWSNEEKRATVLVDLIHMAFACDLSRSASLMFTYAQCFLNANPIYGYPSDFHELGHYSMGGGAKGADAVADAVGWHVKHIATLMKKLAETPDVDGKTLLDNTALALVFEGGVGYDPEQDKQGSAHSSENMIVLVGGKAGGLNAGGGKHLSAPKVHPAAVLNTVMKAVGVEKKLGEVTDLVPGLLG